MNTIQNQKTSTLLIASGIVWLGAIISTAIILFSSEDHFVILPILMSCGMTNLIILSYHPKSGSK